MGIGEPIRPHLDPSKAIVSKGGIWTGSVQSLRWIVPNSAYRILDSGNEIFNRLWPVQFFVVIGERIELRFRFWRKACQRLG